MRRRRTRHAQNGQIIIVFALAILVIVVAVGLVIDSGYAWAHQRHTQNSADAAARSGALVLARRAAQGSSSAVTDTDVRNEILKSLTGTSATLALAQYTDYLGTVIGPSVGSLGSASPPAAAAGVKVAAQRVVATNIIRVIGLNNWTITQEATAVSGPTAGCIETDDGCQLLPVTFPVNVFACTDNGKTQPVDPPQQWASGQEIVLPLCGGNPGSVGWIDWTPPAGGTSELADVIANPPPISIPLPSWQYITETGDISAKQVEDALNAYAGEVVMVPMFADTCQSEPPDKANSFCPAGSDTGAGQNQWYFITKFLAFRLSEPTGAYIQGGTANEAICGTNAKECLKGAFVSFITEGNVGPPCTPAPCQAGTGFAVQLVR